MKSIVVNTLSGAVTEYSRPLACITTSHGGSREGVFALEGDTDHGQSIVGELRMPTVNYGSTLAKSLAAIYACGDGLGEAIADVHTHSSSWSYPLRFGGNRVARANPGRGIREVYLGFGLRFVQGQDFRLDRVEVLVNESKNRRVI